MLLNVLSIRVRRNVNMSYICKKSEDILKAQWMGEWDRVVSALLSNRVSLWGRISDRLSVSRGFETPSKAFDGSLNNKLYPHCL